MKKACKDCKHFSPHESGLSVFAKCAKTPLVVNVVDGTSQHEYCTIERHAGLCGPDAKNFEDDNCDINP